MTFSDELSDVPEAGVTDLVAGSAPGGTVEVADRERSLYRINGTLMRIPGPMVQSMESER